jgi:hypothetical protein
MALGSGSLELCFFLFGMREFNDAFLHLGQLELFIAHLLSPGLNVCQKTRQLLVFDCYLLLEKPDMLLKLSDQKVFSVRSVSGGLLH